MYLKSTTRSPLSLFFFKLESQFYCPLLISLIFSFLFWFEYVPIPSVFLEFHTRLSTSLTGQCTWIRLAWFPPTWPSAPVSQVKNEVSATFYCRYISETMPPLPATTLVKAAMKIDTVLPELFLFSLVRP